MEDNIGITVSGKSRCIIENKAAQHKRTIRLTLNEAMAIQTDPSFYVHFAKGVRRKRLETSELTICG
jgi:hypothetical protein